MATSKEIIRLVDENKPNVFSEAMKFAWLMELQGQIALNILLMDIADVQQLPHKYPDDLEADLLVGYPHEQIYALWLEAKIDYAHGEYNKYENTMQAYNAALDAFERWFVETYDPGGKWPNGRGIYRPTHYITAYGLAVMKGFQGTLEEWLQSLEGEQGPAGVTPDIQVGTVTTLEAGQPATVTRTGTDERPVFNFGIPRGLPGADGAGGGGGGSSGGYYTPSVSQVDDNTMRISFLKSQEGMAAVAEKDIKLPEGPQGIQGPQGESGVYVGAQEPPEDADVWINPDGEGQAQQPAEGFVRCSSLGMTPKDDNGDNFGLLAAAMADGKPILVDDFYRFIAPGNTSLNANVELTAANADCGFDLSGVGTVFSLGSQCASVKLQGLRLSNAMDTIAILFSADRLEHRMQQVTLEGCHVDGKISPIRIYQADVDPSAGDVGIDSIYVAGNTVKNDRASFLAFPDVSFNTMEICGNVVENFDNVFVHSGVTNEYQNAAALTRQKKRYLIHDNTLICDDSWFHNEASTGSYYVFILAEGMYCHYYRNHVEGMKSRVDVALYDAYLSCQEVLYENNTWKNNCVFAATENNNLMKAKESDGVGYRCYRSNRFIAEKAFYEKHGAADGGYFIQMVSNTSPNTWTIEDNAIDVYRLKGFTSSAKMAGIAFRRNTLRCDVWSGSLLAGVEGARVSCEDNEIVCVDGADFGGVRTGDFTAEEIVFCRNRLTNCRYPLGNGMARKLTAQDNVCRDTSANTCRMSSYGTYGEAVGGNNRLIKDNGYFSPFFGYATGGIDYTASTVLTGALENEPLLFLSEQTDMRLMLQFSGSAQAANEVQVFQGYVLLDIQNGTVQCTDKAGIRQTLALGATQGAVSNTDIQPVMQAGSLPFTVRLRTGNTWVEDVCIHKTEADRTELSIRLLSLGPAVITEAEPEEPEVIVLPQGYTRLSHIESDGTQAIDTGILASEYAGGLSYEFQGEIVGYANTAGHNYLLGCLSDGKRSGNVSFPYENGAVGRCTVACGGNSHSLFVADQPAVGEPFTLRLQNVTAAQPYNMSGSIGGKSFTKNTDAGVASEMPTANIYLLKCNGSANPGIQVKVTRFKMIESAGGALLRDMIPCSRDADGAVGLYDLVEGTLHENVGTGSFTKGENVQ